VFKTFLVLLQQTMVIVA